jgi:hypothetical protein
MITVDIYLQKKKYVAHPFAIIGTFPWNIRCC